MTRWRNTHSQLGSWGPWYFLANPSLYHVHIFWVKPAFVKRINKIQLCTVWWCSVAKLCLTLYDPMDCSTSGFPVLHCLPEFAQTHVHWVDDPSSHLILHCPRLLLTSVFPSIRVFSNESALRIRWPKYWSFRTSPPSEYSGLISFRIDWFDLFVVQRTLKSLLQHHILRASVLHIRWPKYWSFSISPFNEYSGLISFRIDWFDLLAVQGTFTSLLLHHNSKVSVL